ncbi:energy transducer TonB [Acinetobacter johnsonii]|uniref:energy transducer TonB n=1 Tax=Acinetobacter johnsonii TaxID=40214 RepID=UPI0022075679|nr:energy transducer TonB [Acinetobacter sp.]USI87042.1 energy transducer TonB [Acinetobacter johnsonii]
MMATVSKIRFRDQGLALSVTAGLHIALIAWLCTVEMHETLVEPKPKTIQLQFVQIPPPAKQQPEPKKPEPIVEEKPLHEPVKKQVEKPAEAQPKTTKKFVESQSNKIVPTVVKPTQQVVKEKQTATEESQKTVDTQSKADIPTQTKTQKSVEPKAQTHPETFDVKNYQPVAKIAPAYPEQALDRKLEGDCTVMYSVNEKGRVENPKAQGDCHPMFVRPSIQAALTFKYQPRLVDGKPTSVSNVKNTFQYRIES